MTKDLGGRPTKLTEETREATAKYYTDCIENSVVPTAPQLAVILDVSRSTLYKWAENDDWFSDMLEKIQTLQEASLLKGGLENILNPTITKLMLSKHGYSDKQEIDQVNTGKLRVELVNFADVDDTDTV